MNLKLCYAGDFETTTDENDCRVWAYSLCNIDNHNEFIYGNSLDDFFEICQDEHFLADIIFALPDYNISNNTLQEKRKWIKTAFLSDFPWRLPTI